MFGSEKRDGKTTNCGKTQFVVDQLRGPFRGLFSVIVLICPTYAVNDTYRSFAKGDKGFFCMSPNASASEEVEQCLEIVHNLFHDNKLDKVLVIYILLTEREVRTGEYCSSSPFTCLWTEPLRRGP